MVTEYNLDNNNYKIYRLKGTIFLFNDDLIRSISIDGDSTHISLSGKPLTVRCDTVQVSEQSSIDGRFSFSHTVTFKVQGYDISLVGYKWIGFQDASGECWLLNPMLNPLWTYKYTLDSEGESTTYTVSLTSNFPLLHIVGNEKFDDITRPCGYRMSVPMKLWLNESDYSSKDKDGTILYTNDGFKKIEFIKDTLSLTEEYDGENVMHSLSFKIPFSSYKESFHYNLLEFTDNTYACVVEKTDGTYASCGFYPGLFPSYSISCDTNIENADSITITLSDKHNGENFFSVSDDFSKKYESSRSSEFRMNDECLECVGYGVAKFIMKTEVDALGNPTGNYYALRGYENELKAKGYNIIGTFDDNVSVPYRKCKVEGTIGCYFNTDLTDMTFHEKGEKKYFSIQADGGWKITYNGSNISFSEKETTDSNKHNFTIKALVDPASIPYQETFTVTYCDGYTNTYNAYINQDTCNDSVSNDTVPKGGGNVLVKSDCCILFIGSPIEGVHSLKTNEGYIVSIPPMEGNDERIVPIDIARCQGAEYVESGRVNVRQTPYYYRWDREGTQCSDGYLCDFERMYSGDTSSYITARTETTRLVNCVTDPTNCPYDRTRWVLIDDTICDGKSLCSMLAEETSSDGIGWTRTGKLKIDKVIDEHNDSVCSANSPNKYGKWMEVDGYICEGTTKYKKIAFFESDTIDGTYTRTNVVDKGDVWETNSTDCGWFEGIDDYETRWEKVGEECIGTSKYNKLQAKYYNEDGTEYIPTNTTKQYKYNLIEEKSEDCGYVDEDKRWVSIDDTICDGKALCSLLAEETSNDGIVWTRTGKLKIDKVIDETNDTVCGPNSTTKYGKWIEVSGYICEGTTKYKKIAFFQSITLDGTYTRTNVEDKGDVIEHNSKDCGWFEGIDDYETRWENVGEECRGTSKYAKLQARYYNEDGTEYIPTNTKKQYRYEEIEKNSKDCGYIDIYMWVLTDNIKCFECNG